MLRQAQHEGVYLFLILSLTKDEGVAPYSLILSLTKDEGRACRAVGF